jgi:hypothetical protein
LSVGFSSNDSTTNTDTGRLRIWIVRPELLLDGLRERQRSGWIGGARIRQRRSCRGSTGARGRARLLNPTPQQVGVKSSLKSQRPSMPVSSTIGVG